MGELGVKIPKIPKSSLSYDLYIGMPSISLPNMVKSICDIAKTKILRHLTIGLLCLFIPITITMGVGWYPSNPKKQSNLVKVRLYVYNFKK